MSLTAPSNGLPERFFHPTTAIWAHTDGYPSVRTDAKLPSTLAVSFEVMPPRTSAAAPRFWDSLEKLVDERPDFISVTYGAAGQDRKGARQVAGLLARHSPTPPIAHLTCIGTNVDEVRHIVGDYLDSGIRTFLALRGDAPVDNPAWHPSDESLTCASDLIRLIREVDFQRCALSPGTALKARLKPLRIGVAAFPTGNAAAKTTIDQEVARLVTKQISGADFAITQLFYRAEDYVRFVEAARSAGVTIPIIPGILPPVSLQRIRRVHELTGVEPPRELVEALESSREELKTGIGFGARLVAQLVQAGAPGIHVYTFNQADPALSTLREAATMMH